jgi:ankyrin repeat protein
MKLQISLVCCVSLLSIGSHQSYGAAIGVGVTAVAVATYSAKQVLNSYYQTPEIGNNLIVNARNNNVEKLKEIIGQGYLTSPDTVGNGGTTALTSSGSKEVVDYLVSMRADVNFKTKFGYTPLMSASMSGNKPVIKALLDNKADPDAQNTTGETALSMTLRYRDPLVSIQSLLEGKANPNIAAHSGQTPLMYVMHKNQDAKDTKAIATTLIEAKANVNATNIQGETALMQWVEFHSSFADLTPDFSVLNLLLEHKADINHQDISGNTALMQAAKVDNAAHVAKLLEYKADPFLTNHDNLTAIQLAQTNSNSGRVIYRALQDIKAAKAKARQKKRVTRRTTKTHSTQS